jgi:hypothetical protein
LANPPAARFSIFAKHWQNALGRGGLPRVDCGLEAEAGTREAEALQNKASATLFVFLFSLFTSHRGR